MSLMHINAPETAISATTTSARAAYGVAGTRFLSIINLSATDFYVKSGNSTIEATTSDTLIPAYSGQWTFEKDLADTHLAFITAAGTATGRLKTGTGE